MTNSHELTDEQEKLFIQWRRDESSRILSQLGAKTVDEALIGYGSGWLIEGWIASSVTVVSGLPESGKSTLVADIAAAIIKGERWYDTPIESGKPGPVIVVVTDAGDIGSWATKAKDHGVDWSIIQYRPGIWDQIEMAVELADAKLLVFDNITGSLDDPINDADPSNLTAPLTKIADSGTPVIAIAHSTKSGGEGPQGPVAYQAWRRHGLHVVGKGNGKRTVSRTGNQGTFPKVTLGTGVETPSESTLGGSTRTRSTEALDANLEVALWVVSNCQGIGINQAGTLIADKFGGAESTRAKDLKAGGKVAALLERTGAGSTTTWELKSE